MDRYQSIIGPMASYHWKPIEKPLGPMVARLQNHRKNILFQLLLSNHSFNDNDVYENLLDEGDLSKVS